VPVTEDGAFDDAVGANAEAEEEAAAASTAGDDASEPE
jgi:hypothetical protein